MSNPYFSNSEAFGLDKNGRPRAAAMSMGSQPASPGTSAAPAYGSAPGPGGPAYGTPAGYGYGAPSSGTQDAPNADQLQAMYDAPSATTAQTKRLTYDDVIIKTGGLLALLIAVAAVSFYFTREMPALWLAGMVVGLVLGLVNAFKRNPSPALIIGYTLAEGVFLGGISWVFSQYYGGAVPTAVLATFATFGAALALFSSGKVRVTSKFVKWVLIFMVGYLVFSILNAVLLWTGVMDGWGMRGGPIGILVGLFVVGLAAASLIVDFDSIKRGVEAGVPAKFAWSAAFGLEVTLIWLYVEILRLVAIFGSRN